jgi:DNA-binding CsgD family transcriptional regulator
MKPETQYINYLAIETLEKFENIKPTQKQISRMESLISTIGIELRFHFDRKLTTKEHLCLLHTAKRKIFYEKAKLLGLQIPSIEIQRKKIKKKLTVSSMVQVISEGLRYGVIQPYMI